MSMLTFNAVEEYEQSNAKVTLEAGILCVDVN